jgi:hypothetical protein
VTASAPCSKSWRYSRWAGIKMPAPTARAWRGYDRELKRTEKAVRSAVPALRRARRSWKRKAERLSKIPTMLMAQLEYFKSLTKRV